MMPLVVAERPFMRHIATKLKRNAVAMPVMTPDFPLVFVFDFALLNLRAQD